MSVILPRRFVSSGFTGYIYEKTSPGIGASWSGLDIRDNGTRIYLTSAARNVGQRDLSAAWDIGTIGALTTNATIARNDLPSCRIRDDDGTQLWYLKNDLLIQRIYKWEMATAYTIVGATTTGANSTDLTTAIITSGDAFGLSIHPDGNKGWTMDNVNTAYSNLVEFVVSPTWSAASLACASPDCVRQRINHSLNDRYWDMTFSDDGRYIFCSSARRLSIFATQSPWSIVNLPEDPFYELDIEAQTSGSGTPSGVRGITVSPDLNKVYILSTSSREIYQYKKVGT